MSPAHEIPVVQLSYIFLNTYKYGITAQCRLTLLARPNMYANCKKIQDGLHGYAATYEDLKTDVPVNM